MKAVHIGMYHPVDDIRIVRKECATLVEEGIDAVFLTKGKSEKYNGNKICGVKIYTYESITTRIKGFRLPGRIIRLIDSINAAGIALKFDAKIYHIHEVELWLIAIILKRKNRKVVFDQHEDSTGQAFQAALEKYHKRWFAKIMRGIVWFQECNMVRNSDVVITASEMIAEKISNYGIKRNIVVLHNYADKNATSCDMSDYMERSRIICYAGGLYERRGIGEVIDAMSLVDGIFEFAGDLNNNLKDKYCKLDGWNRCKYLGKIERKSVNELYGRSRVGIINNYDLPYHRNSNPNKLFEYMAAGLPIICTSIPEWAKIVEDSKCGLVVNALNPKEIAHAINYLLDNPTEAMKMGENGYKRFVEKYNWEAEKEGLINMYKTFL